MLDFPYFRGNYKILVIDLSKQQALDADPTAIQQITFTANLDRAGNTIMFFITDEAIETALDFSQGTVKVLNTISLNNLIFINVKWLSIIVSI